MSTHPNHSGRIPVLDGIRGLAILGVLSYHTTVLHPTAPIDRTFFRIGTSFWTGVDLFFVLSGFLITGILYDAKGSEGFFRNFYARRALRIFPLYFLVLAITFFVLPHLSSLFQPVEWSEQWWYWTYLSNFHISVNGLTHLVLGPTWSLAIEEQFYLLWPLFVFHLSRGRLMAICTLVAVTAFAVRWSFLDAGVWTTEIYVSTFTRMDALAIGSLLALMARGERGFRVFFPWIWVPFVLCGSVLAYFLVDGMMARRNPVMIRYGYSLVALFCGSLIVLALNLREGSWAKRLLTNRVLLFFGKYSYAIYLFNRPFVDVVGKNWLWPDKILQLYGSSIPGQLIYSCVTIALPTFLAVISWHAFEKHFLRLKGRFEYSPRAAHERV